VTNPTIVALTRFLSAVPDAAVQVVPLRES